MEQVINEEEIKILISDYLSSFDPESRRKLSLIFQRENRSPFVGKYAERLLEFEEAWGPFEFSSEYLNKSEERLRNLLN